MRGGWLVPYDLEGMPFLQELSMNEGNWRECGRRAYMRNIHEKTRHEHGIFTRLWPQEGKKKNINIGSVRVLYCFIHRSDNVCTNIVLIKTNQNPKPTRKNSTHHHLCSSDSYIVMTNPLTPKPPLTRASKSNTQRQKAARGHTHHKPPP